MVIFAIEELSLCFVRICVTVQDYDGRSLIGWFDDDVRQISKLFEGVTFGLGEIRNFVCGYVVIILFPVDKLVCEVFYVTDCIHSGRVDPGHRRGPIRLFFKCFSHRVIVGVLTVSEEAFKFEVASESIK